MTYRPDLVPDDYPVTELFGFPPDCDSEEARAARAGQLCPFRGGTCVKLRQAAATPICSRRYRAEGFDEAIWAICAHRPYRKFDAVKPIAFRERAPEARIVREVKITDPAMSFDGVALVVNPDASVDFVGFEAQTIDTRGDKVKPLSHAYAAGEPERWRDRYPKRPAVGVNTANVWKRLLPQVINKGRMYVDWGTRLYVIVQSPVLQFIRRRMHMHELPAQNRASAEIVWLPWDYVGTQETNGQLRTEMGAPVNTTLAQVEQAFTTVAAAQRPVFVAKALKKMEKDDRAIRRAQERAARDAGQQAELCGDDMIEDL